MGPPHVLPPMGAVEWKLLHEATSTGNQPTPGYLYNEIVRAVSFASPSEIPAVAGYLVGCVEGDHAHVKLKALFVIKTLAYRVPPFCACMREHLPVVRDATVFSGIPSSVFGDEPYRLVRDAAHAALSAVMDGTHYHEEYRQMSQRIVGFGNYLPSDDTVLPDGSINVCRDLSYNDITASAADVIQSKVSAIATSVKGMFTGHITVGDVERGLGLGADEECEDDVAHDDTAAFFQGHLEDGDEDARSAHSDPDALGYHPSEGTYIPPCLVPERADHQSSEHIIIIQNEIADLIDFTKQVDLIDLSTPREDACEEHSAEQVSGASGSPPSVPLAPPSSLHFPFICGPGCASPGMIDV